jgi:hypothetical protein
MREGSMDWNTRVLQDLVYDRVRCHVDLLSLVELERELADSIERALDKTGTADPEPDRMSRGLLDQAWRRLEQEWREVREAECPLCSGPYECPPPVA